MPSIKIENPEKTMTSNGRGSLRPPGRSPPFMFIGFSVALCIVAFNYWSVSSRNSELLGQIRILKDEVRTQVSIKMAAERRGEEAVMRTKNCRDENEKIRRDKETIFTNCKMEKNQLEEQLKSVQLDKQDCDNDKLGLSDRVHQIEGELEKEKEKTSQSEKKCDQNACKKHIGNIVNILSNTIGKDTVKNALLQTGYEEKLLTSSIEGGNAVLQRKNQIQQAKLQSVGGNQQQLEQNQQEQQTGSNQYNPVLNANRSENQLNQPVQGGENIESQQGLNPNQQQQEHSQVLVQAASPNQQQQQPQDLALNQIQSVQGPSFDQQKPPAQGSNLNQKPAQVNQDQSAQGSNPDQQQGYQVPPAQGSNLNQKPQVNQAQGLKPVQQQQSPDIQDQSVKGFNPDQPQGNQVPTPQSKPQSQEDQSFNVNQQQHPQVGLQPNEQSDSVKNVEGIKPDQFGRSQQSNQSQQVNSVQLNPSQQQIDKNGSPQKQTGLGQAQSPIRQENQQGPPKESESGSLQPQLQKQAAESNPVNTVLTQSAEQKNEVAKNDESISSKNPETAFKDIENEKHEVNSPVKGEEEKTTKKPDDEAASPDIKDENDHQLFKNMNGHLKKLIDVKLDKSNVDFMNQAKIGEEPVHQLGRPLDNAQNKDETNKEYDYQEDMKNEQDSIDKLNEKLSEV